MERTGSATWWGDLESGRGELDSESGALSATPYSAATRFDDAKGTNPEELLGAAHAGCYSMALSNLMKEKGMSPERIDTEAHVTLESVDGDFTISRIRLVTRVEAPGAEPHTFEEAANEAKNGCPLSSVLDTEIRLSATLIN